MTSQKTVAIIGGGISGLSAAYYLHKLAPKVRFRLYEATNRLGGLLRTNQADGWLVESGADSFLAGSETPAARQLADDIGFADELIETNPENRRALVAYGGTLHPVPQGFQLMGTTRVRPILDSTLLSRSGRLRLARERSIPPRCDGVEESLAEFASRRLGVEAYERLVQPLVAGIYSADPTKLSVDAALPRFTEMERTHGSLYQGLLVRRAESAAQAASGARYGMFLGPRHGMESFVREICARLPPDTCVTGTVATSIRPVAGATKRWQVAFADKSPATVDGIIMALPTHLIPPLLHFDDHLATAFAAIEYASVVVVCAGYRREQIEHPLNAFGIVVPQIEGRQIIAVSFASVKLPNRAPAGHELLRVFVGGACQPELAELDDASLSHLVRDELNQLLGVRGGPVHWSINRWRDSSPQYHIGHSARVAAIEAGLARWPGLFVAGNAYHGVGIPQSIASGKAAAAAAAT